MTPVSLLPFAAAASSLLLAAASVLRKRPSPATWCFFAGMAALSLDSVCTGMSLRTPEMTDALRWLTMGMVVKSFAPAPWIGFSLTYSRGDYRASLTLRKLPLAVLALVPIVIAIGFRGQLVETVSAGPADGLLLIRFGAAARLLNIALLVSFALVLMNLEQTFRSAVGTARWRIKFVVLGLAVVFGAHVYVRSQALLFSAHDIAWASIESSGLLIGCVLLALAYARAGFAEADVYPSRAVLRSSLTVVLVGGYLFIVGVLAQIVRRFGEAGSFQFQAFVVLLGMAGLAVLLLSDRLRQRVRSFIGRHFGRAQHDSVRVWTGFSRRLADVTDEAGLSAATARYVSETFEVLSVTLWLADAGAPRLAAGLRARPSPFNLDEVTDAWADELKQRNPATFPETGGSRWCVPLMRGEQVLGALLLADRVNGAAYTAEALDLLKCIADQVTSVLLNLRLADQVAQAREMEAFRTMSAFFVHDLKNAAASLNLMLKNLPVHFDNPAFRQDALRAVGNTARRIDEIIARLGELRQRPDFNPSDTDLNELVTDTIRALDELHDVTLTTELNPLPGIYADSGQLQSVIANLLLNARDALGQGGRIEVCTERRGGWVVLSVADNGCGMSPAFLRDSLFRPFQSTKKNGLGIGMFQSKMIVEAHGGSIQVESAVGKGAVFSVSLPAKVEP